MKVLKLIQNIQSKRLENKIHPIHALDIQIILEGIEIGLKYKDIIDELEELKQSDKIEWGNSINNEWFKIKN